MKQADTQTKDALGAILSLLPECGCDISALCRGAEYFSVSPGRLRAAAEELPLNHQLGYKGVRMLLSACLEEFAELFEEGKGRYCEVTVPAPEFAIYALQDAGKDLRFRSGAFFAQIVLRGLLLSREPLDLGSCSKRHCGLNRMRIELLRRPPVSSPDFQLQFGALCDGCVKAGEYAAQATRTFSVSFPEKRRCSRDIAADFYRRVFDGLGITPGCENIKNAFRLYGRLMKAENRLIALCSRGDRASLWGNSLALAQSVQLFSSGRTERLISGLELLTEELEDAPKARERRMYCYYVPFLQPEIDRRFRDNGVTLTGNAAFLQTDKYVGLDLAGMTEAWLDNMANRASPEKQCAAIAKAMAASGSGVYFTGAFGFDRRLGAAVPLQRLLLRDYGIETRVLDTDFWCENAMLGEPLDRIDQLCGIDELIRDGPRPADG